MNKLKEWILFLWQKLIPLGKWLKAIWQRVVDWYQTQQEVIKKQNEVSHEQHAATPEYKRYFKIMNECGQFKIEQFEF